MYSTVRTIHIWTIFCAYTSYIYAVYPPVKKETTTWWKMVSLCRVHIYNCSCKKSSIETQTFSSHFTRIFRPKLASFSTTWNCWYLLPLLCLLRDLSYFSSLFKCLTFSYILPFHTFHLLSNVFLFLGSYPFILFNSFQCLPFSYFLPFLTFHPL